MPAASGQTTEISQSTELAASNQNNILLALGARADAIDVNVIFPAGKSRMAIPR
jgi:hypothetical protein